MELEFELNRKITEWSTTDDNLTVVIELGILKKESTFLNIIGNDFMDKIYTSMIESSNTWSERTFTVRSMVIDTFDSKVFSIPEWPLDFRCSYGNLILRETHDTSLSSYTIFVFHKVWHFYINRQDQRVGLFCVLNDALTSRTMTYFVTSLILKIKDFIDIIEPSITT